MNEQEINIYTATEIMGWVSYTGGEDEPENPVFPHVKIWYDSVEKYSEHWLWSSTWNPAEDLNQVVKVADVWRLKEPKFRWWRIVSPDGRQGIADKDSYSSVVQHKVQKRTSYAESPSLALCRALIKLIEEMEEED